MSASSVSKSGAALNLKRSGRCGCKPCSDQEPRPLRAKILCPPVCRKLEQFCSKFIRDHQWACSCGELYAKHDCACTVIHQASPKPTMLEPRRRGVKRGQLRNSAPLIASASASLRVAI